MDPSLFSLDGNGTCSVLDFSDGVIFSKRGKSLFINDRMLYIIAESEAYTAAGSRIYEVIHGSCVECIFSVHELGKQTAVPLLGTVKSLQIIQSLPVFEILRPYYSRSRNRS